MTTFAFIFALSIASSIAIYLGLRTRQIERRCRELDEQRQKLLVQIESLKLLSQFRLSEQSSEWSELGHEIRNSLAGILSGCEAMLMTCHASESRPLVELIHRQATLLSTTIDKRFASSLSVASPEITAPISSELKKEFTVLLIDDRRDTTIPLQTLLAKDGHRVEVAQNGLMGVKKAQECKPDLILCDLGLPGEMDGWDVIKAIRNDPILERVYVVAMSGSTESFTAPQLREAGFDFGVTKPIGFQNLQQLVQSRPRFTSVSSLQSAERN